MFTLEGNLVRMAGHWKGMAFNALYNRYFEVVRADTDALRHEVYRIRYQVYCVEHPFEDPAAHPQGIETDAYDAHSVHLLLRYRPTNEFVGTIRIVLPRPDALQASFPLQGAVDHPRLRDAASMMNHCEISRYCILGSFRSLGRQDGRTPLLTRLMRSASLGLLRGAMEAAVDHGINNCLFVVEPRLLRTLERCGVGTYEKLGGIVEFHGQRQPIALDILDSFEYGQMFHPDAYAVISDGGRIHGKIGHSVAA